MAGKTYTVSEVAELLECAAMTVRRAAIKLDLGRKVTERMRILSESDIDKIKAAIHKGPGQPRKKPSDQ